MGRLKVSHENQVPCEIPIRICRYSVDRSVDCIVRECQIIRPFVGDLLVILLMYAFVRVFIEPRNHILLAVCILVFAYLVEIGQYFELVSRLGLVDSEIAWIVIGTSFDWLDLLAYTIGFMIVIVSGIKREIDI